MAAKREITATIGKRDMPAFQNRHVQRFVRFTPNILRISGLSKIPIHRSAMANRMFFVFGQNRQIGVESRL